MVSIQVLNAYLCGIYFRPQLTAAVSLSMPPYVHKQIDGVTRVFIVCSRRTIIAPPRLSNYYRRGGWGLKGASCIGFTWMKDESWVVMGRRGDSEAIMHVVGVVAVVAVVGRIGSRNTLII